MDAWAFFYLAALVVGAGILALQQLLGGDGNGDSGDANGHADAAGHGESGFLPIFLSLRFWTFGLLAFGLAGTLLHYFDLANRGLTAVIAGALGLTSGFGASWLLLALGRQEITSGAEVQEAVGHVGRVLLACKRGAHGKVRIELRGQTLDVIATTDDAEIEAGAVVLVEEVTGTMVRVSRAPRELLPERSEG